MTQHPTCELREGEKSDENGGRVSKRERLSHARACVRVHTHLCARMSTYVSTHSNHGTGPSVSIGLCREAAGVRRCTGGATRQGGAAAEGATGHRRAAL